MVMTLETNRISGLALSLGVAMVLVGERAVAEWTITLCNGTGQTLTYYGVNEDPPPARLPMATIDPDATFSIDPAGYNPVFAWEAGISMTGTDPNGFLVGLALTETPPRIQYKWFHYKVTPGTPGKDPDLQPIFIDQEIFEVAEGAIAIAVANDWTASIVEPPGACCSPLNVCTETGCGETVCPGGGTFFPGEVCTPDFCGPPPVEGACCYYPGFGDCSNVASSADCPDGVEATFIPTTSCAPGLCSTASDACVAADGCTVETPDHGASIDFPADCLSGDTAISIEEGDWESRIYLEGPLGVLVSYKFEPDTLEFCPEAELCFTVDLTEHGLDSGDCMRLFIKQRDQVCVVGGSTTDEQCTTDGDCAPTGTCEWRFRALPPRCDCSDPTMATCCTNPEHFSSFGLTTPIDTDGDGVPDEFEGVLDNCPDDPNPGQEDRDGDGIGDACDRPCLPVPCVLPVIALVMIALLLFTGRRPQLNRRRAA